MTDLFSPLLETAFRTAARFHRNQQRKATDLPYLIHPVGVLTILLKAGFHDDRLLAAALLHDVVEDTDCELEDLEGRFPPEVVRWVAETSERKRDDAGNKLDWLTRKRAHLAHIPQASFEARAIVLADKLHNLMSMLYDLGEGDDLWERFHSSPALLLGYNAAMIAAAAQDTPELQSLRQEAESVLAELCEEAETEPESLG